MNRGMLALAVCGVMGLGLIGCEEKNTSQPPLPRPVNKPAPSTMDKAKQDAKDAATATGEKTGEAMNNAGDKMKDMGNSMMDKAKDMGMSSVKSMIDSAKTKIDELKAGEGSVPADKKTDFESAMSGIQSSYDSLVKNYDASKSLNGDALTAKVKDLTSQANELMKTITDTATKFGIKL